MFCFKSLVTDMQVQLKKERTHVIKQIDNCVEKAIAVIHGRCVQLKLK